MHWPTLLHTLVGLKLKAVQKFKFKATILVFLSFLPTPLPLALSLKLTQPAIHLVIFADLLSEKKLKND